MHEQTANRNYNIKEACNILLGDMGDYIINEVINKT